MKLMLKVDSICTFYGNVQALYNVSIEVNEGELITVIGANGAGKTTLLKSISGFLPPKEGKIIFQGNDVSKSKPNELVKKGIVMVPEGREIFPHMTVHENLEMGAFHRKDRKEIQDDIEWIYELFPILKEKYKQKGGDLSGGQQQMLAIGRGLMAKPKLLLLDEPSLGLAPIIVKEIFDIIVELNKQGTTIILVEQNANLALKIADRAYVLETGHIEMEGPAKEILNDNRVQELYLGMRV